MLELNKVYCMDCIEGMKQMDDNSVDAIVTDPPYGLEFMGKEWDKGVPGIPFWQEMIRVLKPGGFLLSFGGTRTYHRMVCGIEDAGFEIRDTIMWLYGSGFPKSLDIGKAVDKLQGNEREVVGIKQHAKKDFKDNLYAQDPANKNNEKVFGYGKEEITKGTSEWEGWGTALKPACEPIVVARKPLSEKTVVENVLKWGTGGINIDGCRIRTNGDKWYDKGYPHKTQGYDSSSYKIDYKRESMTSPQGRFPTNLIIDEEVGELLDKQSGESKSTPSNRIDKINNPLALNKSIHGAFRKFNILDKGGASRFFMNVKNENIYICPLCYNTNTKANNGEKWKNINVNNVGRNLKITQVIKGSSVQKNVMQIPKEKIVQVVKYVGNLCDLCAISIVQDIVKIQNLDSNHEESIVIQDFTQNYKKCILIQNIVQYVEIMDNIDTTQTTQNLLKLFGSVNHVIINYIQKTIKSEPKRFLYTAKASKSERNRCLDDMEEQHIDIQQPHNSKSLEERYKMVSKNPHPTVKPLSLMSYLIKLVSRENTLILDPFLGSGTTAVACKQLNRNFIGFEDKPEYCKIANKRLSQANLNEWK